MLWIILQMHGGLVNLNDHACQPKLVCLTEIFSFYVSINHLGQSVVISIPAHSIGVSGNKINIPKWWNKRIADSFINKIWRKIVC